MRQNHRIRYVMVFIALTYKKYIPKIMRWLRAKQEVWQRIIPNITSSSDSSSFVILQTEYHSWNLFQKELACVQFMNKCHRVWHSEGQKGQEGEATFFILCNKLFVGKIRWMILHWNIVSFNSLVALNGRRQILFKSLFSRFYLL